MHSICQSPVKALQSRSGSPKKFVGQKPNHVGKQLRHHSRSCAPYRPSSRFSHLELILQRTKHTLYLCEPAYRNTRLGEPPLLQRRPLGFSGVHTRVLHRFCQRDSRANSCNGPPTASTERASERNEDCRACQSASTASICSATSRSPTLAGLSTKSRIAPVFDTSRWRRNPRKNCRFQSELMDPSPLALIALVLPVFSSMLTLAAEVSLGNEAPTVIERTHDAFGIPVAVH